MGSLRVERQIEHCKGIFSRSIPQMYPQKRPGREMKKSVRASWPWKSFERRFRCRWTRLKLKHVTASHFVQQGQIAWSVVPGPSPFHPANVDHLAVDSELRFICPIYIPRPSRLLASSGECRVRLSLRKYTTVLCPLTSIYAIVHILGHLRAALFAHTARRSLLTTPVSLKI